MNNNFDLCVPCLLGLEGPIADELKRMKLDGVRSENGRVYFKGGAQAIAKTNINLRIGERVLVELGRFEARSFDELFEKTKALPWEMLIPRGSIAAAGAWLLFTWLFSLYIVYGGGYTTYGSLAAIIITLLWMYWCMYIILLGAYINMYIYRRRHGDD